MQNSTVTIQCFSVLGVFKASKHAKHTKEVGGRCLKRNLFLNHFLDHVCFSQV